MGRIIVHVHGKIKDQSLNALMQTYSKRLDSESIKIIFHSDSLSAKEYLEKLIFHVKNGELILLDAQGLTLDSIEFSNLVKNWKLNSTQTHLAIGPAEGFPQSDFSKISLSSLTFPHEFAFVILIEQIYRSIQIIKGTKYHK
ncbi:MAG: hypothetical protein CMB64_06245 [Euryarchaeota archaeon]|nr:hypothetical protein [Euryarchaeota archaeon]|tara:strand:- start:2485 stop:2910 length:426 start_codon:yes stop_codon:yes gene_type:complete